MEPKLVITKDGSSTVYNTVFDEHYHSVYGAIQESRHVFIDAGLNEMIDLKDSVDVLEIGLGTGLNALLTAIEADIKKKSVYYSAVEKYPLPDTIYSQLNYCTLIGTEQCSSFLTDIHTCNWEGVNDVSDNFSLTKYKMNIEDISFQNKFDIIYFDAFSPLVQPELWSPEIFRAMFNALKQNGILVTYCAKGEVKRTLKNAGFLLEALPGPHGKREMTRGRKRTEHL